MRRSAHQSSTPKHDQGDRDDRRGCRAARRSSSRTRAPTSAAGTVATTSSQAMRPSVSIGRSRCQSRRRPSRDVADEVVAEVHDDGDERAEVQGDVERLLDRCVAGRFPAEEPAREDQVPARRDRQELREPLHQAEHDGVEDRHRRGTVPPYDRVRGDPTQAPTSAVRHRRVRVPRTARRQRPGAQRMGGRRTVVGRARPSAGRDRCMAMIRDWKPTAIIHTAYRRDDRASIVDATPQRRRGGERPHARLVHVSTDALFAGRPAAVHRGRPNRVADPRLRPRQGRRRATWSRPTARPP